MANSIKAIETKYKGYRFRSRLEARWAVFFDSLGMKWDYEPEGYDLGDAGWYLPDFRLTHKNGYIYVEIKRKDAVQLRSGQTNVYLAGKIGGRHDDCMAYQWRHRLMDKRFAGDKHAFSSCFSNDLADRFRFGYTYCGPFYDDNHGCYMVHERAQSNIKSCQVVFAWIDSEDAYGTFAEIGYAAALGKTIIIGYSEEMPINDMWFLSEFAKNSGVFGDPESAWKNLMDDYEPSDEEKKLHILSESVANGCVLFMGDPLECDGVIYFGNESHRYNPQALARSVGADYHLAAKKARSARFEHGETP